ncbi:PSD1 and planctomycete cytochrome C domain-containing protein [Rubripirellula tenax]|nr:PSD1 and planctomycete cytochrome C domain-containing protein [Rubripirellula tenax]
MMDRDRRSCIATASAMYAIRSMGIAIAMSGSIGIQADEFQPSEPPSKAAPEIDFARQVQPILAKRCFACHGPDKAEGGLKFVDQESAYAETDSGEHAIVPGDIEASVMIARITTDDEYEKMPPEGDPVTSEEVEILKSWIASGAAWRNHWAFEPMKDPQPPVVADAVWNKNPIDAFVFDSLAHAGLSPNFPADRHDLIRRACYDLTGLPPTAAQVQAFVTDDDPLAFERLVDELLESPQYGQRWGRHWLDLVRYAETNSFERDNPKPNAWKYRDYVIDAFNNDKPYDQFVREQLAGDELANVTKESLIATGYYRLGIWDDEPADPLQARFDEIDDIITTTSQAFLGLTINCARCHDHKIDPIPQTDYYSMVAFLADVTSYATRSDGTSNNQIDVTGNEANRGHQQCDTDLQQIQAKMLEIEQIGIAKMSGPDQRATEGKPRARQKILNKNLKECLDADQWETYQELIVSRDAVQQRRKSLPPRETVMGLARCDATPDQTFVLFRGNPHSPADPVEPAYPAIFGDAPPVLPPVAESAKSAGRRRVLAEWMTRDDNRLTARVMANRLWQFHFGRGIVRSSNNFGQLGTPPTHPLLLDWLAQRLIDGDWKLKSMHRLIMTSRVYQMSSASTDEGQSVDPDNNLFWRFDPRRLSAEEVRDSILAANGSLNVELGGPSFYPRMSAEVLAGQSRPGSGWGDSTEDQLNRRSVYIHVKRSLLTPLLTAFDFPDPDLTCEERFTTLQPGQALSLLNSDFVQEQSDILAGSIGADEWKTNADNEEIVRRTVRAVLQRESSADEIAAGGRLIVELQEKHELSRDRAVGLYCLSVMNWNEFLFVD